MATKSSTLISVFLLCCALRGAVSQCSNTTAASLQLDALFAEYDRDESPPGKVSVTLTLDVKHATVDQGLSAMRLLADLKMVWQDPRLKWNSSEWGCDSAVTSAERLWLPAVALLNAAAQSAGEAALRARLQADGSVAHVARLDLAVPMPMAFADWPWDTQTATFRFGDRLYNTNDMELLITDFEQAVVFETGAWNILSVTGETSTWSRGFDTISIASWTVKVSRRAPAHALAAATVLVAAALLLAAAAALPPQQRPPLAACASFTAALWLISALARLPGAAACPRALAVMCGVCAAGAGSAAGAALVSRLARCSSEPPRPLRALLSSLSAFCRLTPEPDMCGLSESGAWAATAVLLDRVLSGVLLFIVLVLLCVLLF